MKAGLGILVLIIDLTYICGAWAADDSVTAGGPRATNSQFSPSASSDASGQTNSVADSAHLLRMDFRDAPLNLVLEYLSDAAGLIISKETDIQGTVDVWSNEALTKDEAVELLNSALKKNGYAVIRKGRILNVIRVDAAKTADLEVVSGSSPEGVQKSGEMVTQIIPVRYASASQLVNNLQALLASSASLSVNESANSLILIATKTDIRRMLRIIHVLDSSIAAVSSIRVYPLRYADARQLATVIQQLFTSQSSDQNAGGRGGGNWGFPVVGANLNPLGMMGALGNQQAATASRGSSAALKVVAAADETSNSLIVSASPGALATVTQMVEQIDRPVSGITELRVFRLRNADPAELAEQLAEVFPDDTKSDSNQNNTGVRFGGGPSGMGGFGGGPGGAFGGPPGSGVGASQTGASDRVRKSSRVLAVPDSRTSSLLVSAASTLMPQIVSMVETLDANPARKEVVSIYDLHNINPNELNQILQDLFNRNGAVRNNNSSRNSLLGSNDPLVARQTQQQPPLNIGNSGFGGSMDTGGAGGTGTPAGF